MTISHAVRARLVAVAVSALLAACGGGGGGAETPPIPTSPTDTGTVSQGVDITNVTTAQVEAAKAQKHFAALGVLVGAKVEVRDAFDKSGTVLYETVTDNNGQYTVTLPDYSKYAFFRVTVSGGNDWDVNDTGTRDATPTPFKGEINALVDASDLLNGSVRVTMLSDAAYRLIGGDLTRFDASSLNIELNRVAGLLMKRGLENANAAAVSSDLLQFDATRTEHREALAFGFTELQQPLSGDANQRSLIQKYHAGDTGEMASAWRQMTASLGVAKSLSAEIDRNTVKFQAGVTGVGSISGSPLPNGSYGEAKEPYSTVLPRDGSTVNLTANEIDGAWKFHSWTGCKQVVGTRCEVDLSADVTAIARFALKEAKVNAEVASLGRIAPQDSVTGIRFNADGTATIVSRDAATVAYLNTLIVGSLVQTGHVDHPTVRISQIVSPATVVTANAPEATTAPMTTISFRWTEASPVDVYESISIVADATPMAFDEVRAIEVGDGVSGSVRTVIPAPDFTTSVVAGSVLGTAPTWYVTLAPDARSCRGYGADPVARAALQTAWEAAPRGYPFNTAALANCVATGNFSLGGDLTDYVMGKSTGDVDQFSGRHDGTGKLAMRLPKDVFQYERKGTMLASAAGAAGAAGARNAEPVWVSGVGIAVPLGNNLFLASREREAGFRLVALKDTAKITTQQAVRQARSDCAMQGLPSACGLLAGLERERQGLSNVGMIPLLSSPLSVTLSKPGTNLSGTISLNLNIDLRPKASVDWSLRSLWIRASAGADYEIKPELGLTATYGKTPGGFRVPVESKKKKFDAKRAKDKVGTTKVPFKKTLIKIDLGRAIPYAGAVLDLSLNLEVGVDFTGEMSVTITPTLTMAGDFGVRGYYEWRCCRSNDREFSAWFNMPTRQPGISGELKGTLAVEPYAELNLAAGLRGVAPEVAKVFVRGGVMFRGEAATSFSYATMFREERGPSTRAEGRVVGSSRKYWEDCSLDTRVRNGGSCACNNDETKRHWWGGSYVSRKCVQRGDPVSVPGPVRKIPQRCVNEPELALGVYLHGKAGVVTSSSNFAWPFRGWFDFLNREVNFFDQEWPIWEYPAKDNSPDAELVGCKDIT